MEPSLGEAAEEAGDSTCERGLSDADKDRTAIARANANWPTLKDAAAKNSFDPRILAAVGVRESGFSNVPEVGGGRGRGVFQIDLGQNPGVTVAQAMNFPWAANWAANTLHSNMLSLASRFPAFTKNQLMQATAASYNLGPGGISGNPATIDQGTPGNNYGSNVMDIATCF